MKKYLLSSLLYLLPSFLLTALQGNFYFIPLGLPMVWCIILCLYSFRKSLLNSLLLNIPHTLIVVSFTTVPPSQLILIMNIFTLVCYFASERFHTNHWHIVATSGALCFFFLLTQWGHSLWTAGLQWPNFLNWVGVCIATVLFAPVLIYIIDPLDQRIHTEKVETLENLRV